MAASRYDQARRPTGRYQPLGRPVDRRKASRLRNEHQPGTGAGRRIADAGDTIDAGGTGRADFDRSEMEHYLCLVGQLLEYRVIERRAREVDIGVQAVMRLPGDAADHVTGRHQPSGDGPPDQSSDVGNHDPHVCHLPEGLAKQ
jgi:hypothetical protein